MTALQDKIVGSLIGGAVGDALGYPVEFIYSYRDLAKKYGEGGIREYDLNYPWINDRSVSNAQFSDDTQMTLYTAEGLLYAVSHDRPILPMICAAYVHWLGPQVGKKIKSTYPSELIKIDELNQCRAPGNTCISALTSICAGCEPANNSKGCGGIMRIAPIALYGVTHGWTLAQTARLAGNVAEITHFHPMSTLSSACCAAIIQECLTAEGDVDADRFIRIVDTALGCIRNVYADCRCLDEFCQLINRALDERHSQDDDWQIIEQRLGGGWVADETLAIALFSVVRHLDSFERCMVCAVNHGGDSDSTGAVAGNILGAIVGYGAIPAKFTDTLQLHDLLINTALKLELVP